jgi:hypothetical protein
MDHKTLHGLVSATDRLDTLAFELNKAAVWASDTAGDETAGDLLDQAAKNVLAAARLLDRPLRADPPPSRWKAQASDGQDGWDGTVSPLPPGR